MYGMKAKLYNIHPKSIRGSQRANFFSRSLITAMVHRNQYNRHLMAIMGMALSLIHI